MKAEYQGEIVVDVKDTKFSNYTNEDWIVHWVEYYNCDGAHHKEDLLMDIVRIIKGCKVIVKQASWSDGFKEYRFELSEDTETFTEWYGE